MLTRESINSCVLREFDIRQSGGHVWSVYSAVALSPCSIFSHAFFWLHSSTPNDPVTFIVRLEGTKEQVVGRKGKVTLRAVREVKQFRCAKADAITESTFDKDTFRFCTDDPSSDKSGSTVFPIFCVCSLVIEFHFAPRN